MPYLQACVESILEQDYENYELIISNDHSTDGSTEYLRGLQHHNLTIVGPQERLSMTEHWEWALSFATGEWQIFVGQDDGLQDYFFQLADRLTSEAERRGLCAIVSRRAYYFWPGCEDVYASRVGYSATNRISVRKTSLDSVRALFDQSYHNLPQMYCNSLFKRSLLEQARSLQAGRVFSCHPQDANLAAVSCSLERAYLRCEIPLGWVGTSPKSAGLAISHGNKKDAKDRNELASSTAELRNEYEQSIQKSRFRYNELAGDFGFSDGRVYFWQALLETPKLRQKRTQNMLVSRWFRYVFFSAVRARLMRTRNWSKKREQFLEILARNKLSVTLVTLGGVMAFCIGAIHRLLRFFFYRVPNKLYRMIFPSKEIRHFIKAHEGDDHTIADAGTVVHDLLQSKGWI